MIGVFDSGFGGLTVLQGLLETLPQYQYLYLADSARAPYGARSLDVIQQYTAESVEWLFQQGCETVILACNTASARALRNLQQLWLPRAYPDRRILGVVRPSVEALAGLGPGAIPGVTPPSYATGTVAVLATEGTVLSGSYRLELQKLAPQLDLIEQACPMWVPLVEAGELEGAGTEWFLHRYLDPLLSSPRSPERILLGCTHYPLLMEGIRKIVPASIAVISQAHVVSQGFRDWLLRHPEMERRLSRTGDCRVATTDDPEWFAQRGERILRRSLTVERAFLKAIR